MLQADAKFVLLGTSKYLLEIKSRVLFHNPTLCNLLFHYFVSFFLAAWGAQVMGERGNYYLHGNLLT